MCLDSDGDDEGETTEKKPETVNFVVMLKKNNKPQVRTLERKGDHSKNTSDLLQFYDMAVSSNSEMALKLKAGEQVRLIEDFLIYFIFFSNDIISGCARGKSSFEDSHVEYVYTYGTTRERTRLFNALLRFQIK